MSWLTTVFERTTLRDRGAERIEDLRGYDEIQIDVKNIAAFQGLRLAADSPFVQPRLVARRKRRIEIALLNEFGKALTPPRGTAGGDLNGELLKPGF